jgi:hypothetical protein
MCSDSGLAVGVPCLPQSFHENVRVVPRTDHDHFLPNIFPVHHFLWSYIWRRIIWLLTASWRDIHAKLRYFKISIISSLRVQEYKMFNYDIWKCVFIYARRFLFVWIPMKRSFQCARGFLTAFLVILRTELTLMFMYFIHTHTHTHILLQK